VRTVTITSKVNGKTEILTNVDQKPVKILLQKLHILITSRGATCAPYFMGIGRKL